MPWERIFERWPTYKEYENVEELKNLYDVMSLPENIDKMISSNDDINKPRPPLVGLLDVIMEKKGSLDIKGDKRIRRFIGSMIGEILLDYGYRPEKQMNISHSGGKKQSANRYFMSATRYKYHEKKAIKELHRDLEILSSKAGNETARAGNKPSEVKNDKNIKNNEYIERLEKFRKFYKKYNVKDKVKSIFVSLDIRNENRAQGNSSMTDYSVTSFYEASVFPFVEQISRYSSGMCLNTYQIASLLENKYPGIIELSGLQVTYKDNSSILIRASHFFTMLSTILLEEAQDESSFLESALMSKNYFSDFTILINGLNHSSYNESSDIPIFRLRNSLDITQDSDLKGRFSGYRNEISEEFFKVHNLMDKIVKILKKNTKTENGERPIYYNLYQLIAELSHKNPIKSHYYPVACIFFELMKRIFNGDTPEIKLMIWPGNAICQASYHYKFGEYGIYLEGTANYTPLFSYQPSHSRKG